MIEPEQEVSLTLQVKDIDYILNVLADQPYREVAPVISDITGQLPANLADMKPEDEVRLKLEAKKLDLVLSKLVRRPYIEVVNLIGSIMQQLESLQSDNKEVEPDVVVDANEE